MGGCSKEGVTNSSPRAGQHPHGRCHLYFPANGLTEPSIGLTSILLCLIHPTPPGSASFLCCSLKTCGQDHHLLIFESHVCQYWEYIRIIWESIKKTQTGHTLEILSISGGLPGDGSGLHQRESVRVYHGSRSGRDIQDASDSMS